MSAFLSDSEIESLVFAIEARELFAVMGAEECEREGNTKQEEL